MTEQTKCHIWSDEHNDWCCFGTNGLARWAGIDGLNFCPTCGTRLDANGSTTPMVPAAPDAQTEPRPCPRGFPATGAVASQRHGAVHVPTSPA